MKIHNVALLASLSILPIHQSFAAGINQVGLNQTTSSNSTMVMPIKKASPNKVVRPLKIGKAQLSAPGGKGVVVNLKPSKFRSIQLLKNQRLVLTNGKFIVKKGVRGLNIIGANNVIQSSYQNASLFKDTRSSVWIKSKGKQSKVGVFSRIEVLKNLLNTRLSGNLVLADTLPPPKSPFNHVKTAVRDQGQMSDGKMVKEFALPMAYIAAEIQSLFQGTNIHLSNYGDRRGNTWFAGNDSFIELPAALNVPKRKFTISPMNKIPYRYYIQNVNLSSVQVAADYEKLKMTFNFESGGREIKGRCAGGGILAPACIGGSDSSAPDIEMNNAKAFIYFTPTIRNDSISFAQVETDFSASIQAHGVCNVPVLSAVCSGLTNYKGEIKNAVKSSAKNAVDNDSLRNLVATRLRAKLNEHGVRNLSSLTVQNGYLIINYVTYPGQN